METHETIVSAIRELAEYKPLSVTIPFRGYDIVFMDSNVRAYKIGKYDPLIIKWEELTPVEAFRLKRACRCILARMQQEAELNLKETMRLKETFEKSPFGC